MSQELIGTSAGGLKHTGTSGITLPSTWPSDRYDLVWRFDPPSGSGPIASFSQVPQLLLAGDRHHVIAG